VRKIYHFNIICIRFFRTDIICHVSTRKQNSFPIAFADGRYDVFFPRSRACVFRLTACAARESVVVSAMLITQPDHVRVNQMTSLYIPFRGGYTPRKHKSLSSTIVLYSCRYTAICWSQPKTSGVFLVFYYIIPYNFIKFKIHLYIYIYTHFLIN